MKFVHGKSEKAIFINGRLSTFCRATPNKARAYVSVHLRLVKGYSGVSGKERANAVAKEEAASNRPVLDRPIPRSPSYYHFLQALSIDQRSSYIERDKQQRQGSEFHRRQSRLEDYAAHIGTGRPGKRAK